MYEYPDYLAHYGVLGMKWGQRRARKYAEKASKSAAKAKKGSLHNVTGLAFENSGFKGLANREYKKADRKEAKNVQKADKYKAKSKKIESYHKSMGGTKTYNRVKSQSTAKLVGKSLVLGTYGALNYEQARSAGVTRGKAFLHGAGRGILDDLSSGVLNVVEPRMDKGSNKNK